jgi:hypothetical protein
MFLELLGVNGGLWTDRPTDAYEKLRLLLNLVCKTGPQNTDSA